MIHKITIFKTEFTRLPFYGTIMLIHQYCRAGKERIQDG